MPWGAIEAGFRFATLLLEGIPPEQRRAQALAWFWMWWPVAKLWLKKEQREQVEGIMANVGTDLQMPA